MIYSAASIYANLDRMDAGSLREWLDWHKSLKFPPRYVVLFSAARMNDAPDAMRLIHRELPETTIVWRAYDGRDPWGAAAASYKQWDDSNYYRQLKDQNVFILPDKAAEMWVDRRVMPHQKVISETGAVVMLLNEADPLFNAYFEAQAIKALGDEGIRAGAFAWATGTPDWKDYESDAIRDAVRMAHKYNALVMPHEYAGVKPEEQNSLINRFTALHKVYTDQGLPTPDTLIGELALCKARVEGSRIILDPDVGWRMMDVSETRCVDFLHTTIKTWYLPMQVASSIFDWAGWGTNGSFGVRGAKQLLTTLKALMDAHLNFEVSEDNPHPLTPSPLHGEGGSETPAPVVIETPPTPVPAPNGTAGTVTKRYALDIRASEAQHKLIETALLNVLDALVGLGVALGGTQAAIDAQPVGDLLARAMLNQN